METFRVRLNCVDHYQARPTRLDPPLFGSHGSSQQRDSPSVPVIRVFGATETGQKVCAHIHGALPYLFIEYRGSLKRNDVDRYIHQLRSSIDYALAVSYRRNIYDGKAVFVGHISLVKGVPFFGYHVGHRYFLKIYMLNPINMTRFADLLHQGAIMGQPLQPFEAHLQYLLQWMCDFNLYGCSYIDCQTVKFRHPVPDIEAVSSTKHKWHSGSIPPNRILNADRYPRQSHCSIEVDIRVENILNRHDIEMRDQHASFVERFSSTAPDEKLVHSLAGLWRDETRRRKRRMGLDDTSSSPFPPEVLVSMSADARNKEPGGWIHEDEFRDLVQGLVETEREHLKDTNTTFDDFVQPHELDGTVKTVTESVQDLFSSNLQQPQPMVPLDSLHAPANLDELLFDPLDFPLDSDQQAALDILLAERGQTRDSGIAQDTIPDVDTKPDQMNEPLNTAQDRSKMLSSVVDDDAAFDITVSQQEELLRNLDDIEDFADSDRPQKRRKIHGSSAQDPQRHVSFQPQMVQDQTEDVREPDDAPMSSQQLSQTSIKSADGENRSNVRFKVVKHPGDPTMTPGSKPFDQPNQSMPQTTMPDPILGRTNSMTSKKPSSTPSSNPDSKTSSSNPEGKSEDLSTQSPSSSQVAHMAACLVDEFSSTQNSRTLCFKLAPPSPEDITTSLQSDGRPAMIYQDAYYSNELDVPERAREYAGREFKLESNTLPFLPDFDPSGQSLATLGQRLPILRDKAAEKARHRQRRMQCRLRHWEIAADPPSYEQVQNWLDKEATDKPDAYRATVEDEYEREADNEVPLPSQIDGPTQMHKHGFKFPLKQNSTSVQHETQYMSILSLEVHVNTRGKLAPNPEQDEIACVFWCLKSDEEDVPASNPQTGTQVGVLVLADATGVAQRLARELAVEVVEEETELDLINRMVDIVRIFDPDILTGYEVHNGSWGYLIERARIKFEYNLCDEFSRMKSQSHGRFGKDADRWGFNHTSTVRVTGRHTINIWRAMRSELNLLQYTMENVVFHLLHKRIPHYSFADLTRWYTSRTSRDLAKCLDYFLSRVQLNLDILDANELIPRTSEQARLIGVDFFSVFSRGSQFKVESFMFRIAKPENFVLVSPSRKQVGQQNALECLPLVMEPQSAFYTSPLLVLDFQSLYPSIMIAYNYCYSTCLGRIVGWRGTNKMGFADFKRQPGILELVKDSINISPNGLMFVKPEMRKSLLAKMLGEILETRVMVKSGMKVDKADKTLQQLLNNRQLALKLLANVTYGYTSASFSGRMPCSEIADAIVQTARETLERAVAFIHSVERWGAEVVYGDTDSLFIYLKGRTKDQAFSIGAEIAKEVTAMNPRPIKLKFEKVYHPCVLLAKKRYVGFKYESASQTEPEFDAKGIETVRRDGTPAEQKIEEKALKILFRTADLSQVKAYFQRQCKKIMTGRVSIQDFCFAREVKLGSYADKGPPPAGALISTKRMLQDPRAEPQYGERVPYVVVTGAPGARLIDRCVAPQSLLSGDEGSNLELDAEYYIGKNLIPPLERIFNLVGANVRGWWDEMPKVQRVRHSTLAASLLANGSAVVPVRRTLEGYMQSSHCVVCRAKVPRATAKSGPAKPLCRSCLRSPATVLFALRTRAHAAQTKSRQIEAVCRSCAGLPFGEHVRCDSMDCPVYYSRVKAKTGEGRVVGLVEGVERLFASLAVDKQGDEAGPLAW